MRYFTYVAPDEHNQAVYHTLSEDDIRREYFPYWEGAMIKKFGEEEYRKRFSFVDCLDDWQVDHWAWEVFSDWGY
jgi:hypothetical protein